MGNIITLSKKEKGNPRKWLELNNGYWSFFFGCLTFSLSQIANSLRQKELTIWIATHSDQHIFGRGWPAINQISDIPWIIESLEADKKFFRDGLEYISKFQAWSSIEDYNTADIAIGHLTEAINVFTQLLEGFGEKYIEQDSLKEFLEAKTDPIYGIHHSYPKCWKHNTLLHHCGCIICNEMFDIGEYKCLLPHRLDE